MSTNNILYWPWYSWPVIGEVVGEVIYFFDGNSLFLPTAKIDICDKTRFVISILQELVLEKKQMTAELFRNHFPIGFPVGKKWWQQNAFKIIFDQNYNKKKGWDDCTSFPESFSIRIPVGKVIDFAYWLRNEDLNLILFNWISLLLVILLPI